jgi:oligopeptidase B
MHRLSLLPDARRRLARALAAWGAACLGAAAFAATPSAAPQSVDPAASAASAPSTDARLTAPPVAARRPHAVVSPNGTRDDPYYWLRDDTRQDPEMLAYLAAENAWTAQHVAAYRPLEEKLFAEMRSRVQEDDSTAPYLDRGDWYATRYATGQQYPIYVRHVGRRDAAEEVLLDVNELAKGHDFYAIEDWEVSDDKKLLAYSEDAVGRRQWVVRIKDLATGQVLPDRLPGTSGDVAWAADNRTLFYVENDATTLRSRRVKRHVVGTDPATDVVVHDEKDESYYTAVKRSASQRYVIIELNSTESDELRVLRADTPAGAFQVVAPRRDHFHYQADHIDDRWVIVTDWQAPNYRVMEVSESKLGDRARWTPLVPHDKAVFIEGIALLDRALVLDERAGGVRRLRVLPWAQGRLAGPSRVVSADEAAYAASLDINKDVHAETVRYRYTSLTTPATTYDLNVTTGERTLVKRQPVPGYDASKYVTERVWAKSRDGTRVPVSVLRLRSTPRDGTAPLWVYGYGSYGLSTDPNFRSPVFSLVDRGFVFAIAHVRGGQEMGRAWYEDGKLLHKKNTFTDFVDATEALLKEGYGARGKVIASGGSAGGLLMGAITNLRPDLYRGIDAAVPFVDVVTTMLDESIPLTTNEFDEWGNPKQAAFYRYMLSYSPYDNVKPVHYPAMYVSTGLWDSQVQYYEPTKWVARLRWAKHLAGDDATPLVLKVNMEAGHGGKSGRFERLEEIAGEYAFMLDLLGIRD